MIPTSIDGTDITGATIDGQDVQEITVDGDTVFTAGPTQSPTPALSEFSFVRDFSPGNRGEDVLFNEDGGKMWLLERDTLTILEFNLSSPYNISSTSQVASYTPDDSSPQAMRFNNDGTKFYEAGDGDNTVREFTLVSPFDLSGRTQTGSFVPGIDVYSIDFSLDGSVLVIGGLGIDLEQYNLTTPFDVTTAPATPSQTNTISGDIAKGLEYSTSGDRLFIADKNGRKIEEFPLTTNFDISTLGTSINTLSVTDRAQWIKFSNDEQSMYIGQRSGVDGGKVEQYNA